MKNVSTINYTIILCLFLHNVLLNYILNLWLKRTSLITSSFKKLRNKGAPKQLSSCLEFHTLDSRRTQKTWKGVQLRSYNAWTLSSRWNESTHMSEAKAAGFVDVRKQWACQNNKNTCHYLRTSGIGAKSYLHDK